MTGRDLKVSLTRRERDIVRAILDGCTNRDIADRFKTSEQTVKNQLTRLYLKVGVSNRLQLAMTAMRRHLVDSD